MVGAHVRIPLHRRRGLDRDRCALVYDVDDECDEKGTTTKREMIKKKFSLCVCVCVLVSLCVRQ